MIPNRLTFVTLGVADVARATAFYEALGWRPAGASQEGEVTFINTVGPILALFGWQALADDAGVAADRPADDRSFRGSALAINLGSPDEVDAAVFDWEAAGGAVVKAAHETSWGGYNAYVADVDGHLWEIAHNPHFPTDLDGRVLAPD